jgi:hypothetical protein
LKAYQGSVHEDDIERAKSVDRARAELVANLKTAQKAALKRDDVEGATACAELVKENGPLESFAGRVVKAGNDEIRLNADGTITNSDKRYGGTWGVIADRTVAVVFSHGYVDIWKFDTMGKSYKGAAYRHDRDYEGVASR